MFFSGFFNEYKVQKNIYLKIDIFVVYTVTFHQFNES